MFKPQTKDKQRIDELEKENYEFKAEIVRLKVLVSIHQENIRGILKMGNEAMI